MRSGWIRALYPAARVIEAWEGPTEVGCAPALMRGHERYAIDVLGVKGVTHFYSSEPYGEHMSRALGGMPRPGGGRARGIPTRFEGGEGGGGTSSPVAA